MAVRLIVHPSAEQDLDSLYESDDEVDTDSAAEIETLLDEIQCNQKILSAMHRKGFRHLDRPAFDVDYFYEAFQKHQLQLSRLKIYDWEGSLVPYRVIFAYDHANEIIYVLAVVKRNIAYDTTGPIFDRICTDYAGLGLATN